MHWTSSWIPVIAFAGLVSCNGNNNSVDNAASARRAYLGLDQSIDKIINLALQGYNQSTNANIPTETAAGGQAGNDGGIGTVAVSGTVDHGASTNRSIHVTATYTNYSDPVTDPEADSAVLHIVYDSPTAPSFDPMLMNVPNGTMAGPMAGSVNMSGDLMGTVTLNLTISGAIEPVPGSTTMIQRTPGMTHITGTVMSQYGTYNVDVTR